MYALWSHFRDLIPPLGICDRANSQESTRWHFAKLSIHISIRVAPGPAPAPALAINFEKRLNTTTDWLPFGGTNIHFVCAVQWSRPVSRLDRENRNWKGIDFKKARKNPGSHSPNVEKYKANHFYPFVYRDGRQLFSSVKANTGYSYFDLAQKGFLWIFGLLVYSVLGLQFLSMDLRGEETNRSLPDIFVR